MTGIRTFLEEIILSRTGNGNCCAFFLNSPANFFQELLGRGDGSENSNLVISHRYDFALFKAGRWCPTFCESPLQHGDKK
jgi:hypothetical protein